MTDKNPYDMTDEEIKKYISKIASTEVNANDVGEMNIMGEFKMKLEEIKVLDSETKSVKSQMLELEVKKQNMIGAVNCLSTMLVRLEDARRKAKTESIKTATMKSV
jgi:hypothetical protein